MSNKTVWLVASCLMAIALLLVSCVPTAPGEQEEEEEEEETQPPQAQGESIIVTSTDDSGPGTLRQALLDAEIGDTITFDSTVFPPNAPATIYVSSELPHIGQGNLTIDASNAGVILDGSSISEDWAVGLQILSDRNIVQGLQVSNFSGAGIVLSGGAQYNTIGGDAGIGSGPMGQGNLISNNETGIGLWGGGTSFNTITGNLIGTDATGLKPLPNSMGIYISEGASHNTFGPDNIIAYNNEYGISINHSNSLGNTITGNSIHHNQQGGIGLWEGGNTELPSPFLFDFDLASGTVTGTAFANCTVEIFSDTSSEGEVFEGQMTTDDTGAFTLNKGASFIGPHLTTTATDTEGNTSEFSFPTSGTGRSMILQEGNDLPKTQLQSKKSKELADNRMGAMFGLRGDIHKQEHADSFVNFNNDVGFKRVRLSLDYFDWSEIEETGVFSRFYIDPIHDKAITDLTNNGIEILYCLVFWDENIQAVRDYARFKTEEEVERYLDYVRFIVQNLKDRVEYYEILNETFFQEETHFSQQNIELVDYINLVKRVVPVIREEYPEAKIVAGPAPGINGSGCRDYFFGIIESEIMPLVDAIAWHPGPYSLEYDDLRDYCSEYPSIVERIIDVASSHGFEGEYIVEELQWRIQGAVNEPWTFSEIVAAKYCGRGIVMHLGMDITTGLAMGSHELDIPRMRVIRNLCTIMAGADAITIPAEIESEATNIRSYGFSLPNGDRLLALWTDGVAVNDDPGIETTVTLRDLSGHKVLGIDILNSFQQELVTSTEDGNLIINNLLVKDYPVMVRLSP